MSAFNVLLRARARKNHIVITPSGPIRVVITSVGGDGTNFDHSKTITVSNIPAGALMVVMMSTSQSAGISSANDSVNTWSPITAINSNTSISGTSSAFYCINSASANSKSIVCSFNNGSSIYQLSFGAWTASHTWALSSAGVAQATYGQRVNFSLSSPNTGIIFGQVNNNEVGSSSANVAFLNPIGTIVNKQFSNSSLIEISEFNFELINNSSLSSTAMQADINNTANTFASKCDAAFAIFTNN